MVKGGTRGPDSLNACVLANEEVVLSVSEIRPTDVSEAFQEVPELEKRGE